MKDQIELVVYGHKIKCVYYPYAQRWEWYYACTEKSPLEWLLPPKIYNIIDTCIETINKMPVDPKLGPTFAGMTFEETFKQLMGMT
jgi:hypothetical protein